MKANKRIRDLRRRSELRLLSKGDGGWRPTTTYPLTKKDSRGSQVRNGTVHFFRREVAL